MEKKFEFQQLSLDSKGYILIVSYGDNSTAEIFKTMELLTQAKQFIQKIIDTTDLTKTAYSADSESLINEDATKFSVMFCINRDEMILHEECSSMMDAAAIARLAKGVADLIRFDATQVDCFVAVNRLKNIMRPTNKPANKPKLKSTHVKKSKSHKH